MSVNLQKGQKIDLTKSGGGTLNRIMVGLGWDEAPRGKTGFLGSLLGNAPKPIDCDASAILCGGTGKVVGSSLKDYCVFYGNLSHTSNAVVHQGDNLTGEGDGDDEQIMVVLSKMPPTIEKVVFAVNIYDARERKQHFGLIQNAFIRLVDMDTNKEFCRFNLSDDFNNMTGLIVGEIYKRNNEWKFSAVGQPVQEASRLDALINMYR